MAAAGLIPGAAKIGGIWTFNIPMLDAHISEKERETWLNSRRHQRGATGATGSSGAGYKPGSATTDGHLRLTIQKLRASVGK
jgi:hypothetical protein